MKVRSIVGLIGLFVASLETGVCAESSRVIVSTTLNDTLQFFDADSLEELQPPLPSKGGGPVRLWVQEFDGRPFLFAANHGAALGSVGVFDLSADLVTELPLSPFPARSGSVGIAAGHLKTGIVKRNHMVFVTNTFFALGGCGLPRGSVTAYDANRIASDGILIEAGTVELSGAIPFAVAVNEDEALAFATSNCSDTLDTIEVSEESVLGIESQVISRLVVEKGVARATGEGPDAALVDSVRRRIYVTNIDGHSLSVFGTKSPTALTTVPLPGAGPIDANLADGPAGHAWLVTSNGADDSVSLVDRDVVEACIASAKVSCPDAEILRVFTAVAGGAPEGVDYDPATNRIFVVNKTFPPSLSVIQLGEGSGGTIVGVDVAQIPLGALGASVPLPALIAFDVVVQTR